MIGSWLARRNLRRAFRSLEERNLDRFLANWAEDAVFIYPGDVRLSGAHRGKAEVRRFFEQWLEQFPSVQFTLRDIALSRPFDLTGTNVVAVVSRLDATNRDGREVTAELVTVIRLRRGRAVHVQDYVFETGSVVRTAWGDPERASRA